MKGSFIIIYGMHMPLLSILPLQYCLIFLMHLGMLKPTE